MSKGLRLNLRCRSRQDPGFSASTDCRHAAVCRAPSRIEVLVPRKCSILGGVPGSEVYCTPASRVKPLLGENPLLTRCQGLQRHVRLAGSARVVVAGPAAHVVGRVGLEVPGPQTFEV